MGLFGGTFDPPHRGHVRVAADVADALGLARVIWMPVGDPPHKGSAAPAALRLAMTRAAITVDPRFEVGTLETERGGPSYTVDTVRALREREPRARLHVILGADQFAAFDGWREPTAILRMARLAVMSRAGESARSLRPTALDSLSAGERADAVDFVEVTPIDVSSTEVRERIARGRDVSDSVAAGVLAVIEREGLYRP